MFVRLADSVRIGRHWLTSSIAANPLVVVFGAVLAAWTALGFFTLFVGMAGLLLQGFLFLLLPPAAALAGYGVAKRGTRTDRISTGAAFVLALAFIPGCPNDAGPNVYFAVHGAELDALAHELADCGCSLWLDASRYHPEPAYNVDDDRVEPLRRRLRRTGALAVGVRDGHFVFPIDGFADNVRGFAYFAPGTRLPEPGEGFHYGMLGQLVRMPRTGWYFFTTV